MSAVRPAALDASSETPRGRTLFGRTSQIWTRAAVAVAIAALVKHLVFHNILITDYFLGQDAWFMAAAALMFAAISSESVILPPRVLGAVQSTVGARRRAIVLGCAALAVVVGVIGWLTVYHRYPLSLDEFWAVSDAEVLRRGRLVAETPAPWRNFVPGLAPQFLLQTVGHRGWISAYLPVHAAVRALFGLFGADALEGPAWAAMSIVLVYALARRMWPQRPDAAVVAVVLLASSTQLLVTAMTPYAMSAHLALNLLWLWLFKQRGWASQGAAALVAFAAMGLHQLVFPPLFAAPFVAQLWLERRWRPALFHSVAYAVIAGFWTSYYALMLGSQGLAAAAEFDGAGGLVSRAIQCISALRPYDLGLMVENLVRFAAWQNPLAVVLGAIGAAAALKRLDRDTAPLAAGMILTVVAMLVMLAFQGHGWGYRYLHGFLGSWCLLAAAAWTRVTSASEHAQRRAWTALVAATAFVVVVALPARAIQVSQFIAPYARGEAIIQAAPQKVVIVDPEGIWYGQDWVRNDPFLERGPKVLAIDGLTAGQVRDLCARYDIGLVDRRFGAAVGAPAISEAPTPRRQLIRSLMSGLSCGTPLAPGVMQARSRTG